MSFQTILKIVFLAATFSNSLDPGLYTLCFTDTKKMGFKATMERFKSYSTQAPVICRGLGKEQVLVGFPDKCAAVDAFSDNIDSEDFPKLHITPSSRG